VAHEHVHLPEGRLKRVEQWLDRNEVRLLRAGFVVMFVVSLAAGLLAYEATRENRERINQSCTSDEREHLRNVESLRRTYALLESPTQRELVGPGLVRVIVATISDQEALARTDQAPEYCDDPGVGLAEPDPVPPKRKDFSHLLTPGNDPP